MYISELMDVLLIIQYQAQGQQICILISIIMIRKIICTYTNRYILDKKQILRAKRILSDPYQHITNTQHYIQKQKKLFSSIKQNFETFQSYYYQLFAAVTDQSPPHPPQPIDNYLYCIQNSLSKQSTIYKVIFRIEHGNKSKFVDLQQILEYKNRLNKVEIEWFWIQGDDCLFGVRDTNGLVLRIKKNGKYLKTKINNCSKAIFSKDHNKIFYLKSFDDQPLQLRMRNLQNDKQSLLYQQPQKCVFLNVQISKSREYIILTRMAKDRNRLLVQKVSQAQSGRWKGQQLKGQFGDHGDKMYSLQRCNEGIKVYVLGDKEQIIHKTQQNLDITQMDVFKEYLVLYLKGEGIPFLRKICIHDYSYTDIYLIKQVGTINPGVNLSFHLHTIRAYATTPFYDQKPYEINLKNNTVTKLFPQKIQQKRKFNFYSKKKTLISKYIQIPTSHSLTVPLTLLYSSTTSWPAKVLLHVYGFYGQSLQPHYNYAYKEAIKKGWVIGYCHVRGGREKGNKWRNRDGSVDDVLEIVRYLVAHKYTHPSLISIFGSSAGAINAFNAINRQPTLFKCAILNSPFVDVLGTLLNRQQYLSESDYKEFGDPNESDQAFSKIRNLSPYQNIRNISYPPIMIISSLGDDKCPLWRCIKFAQRLRQLGKSPSGENEFVKKNIVMRILKDGGHQSYGSEVNQVYSDIFSFLDYVIFCQNKQMQDKQRY